MIAYFVNHPTTEWPLYRFVELQGRDAIARILSLGIEPLFYYFTFYFLLIKKEHKKICLGILTLVTALSVLSGGRSSILNLLFILGNFVYFYKHYFDGYFMSKLNRISLFLLIPSLLTAALITSFYNKDHTFMDGLLIIINRIFASADVMEYYLLYNGYDRIESGIMPFFMSIFGIYVKRLFGIEYKNIGHQLSELVVGELSFAQGPNYTLPLQVMVFGYPLMPLYIFVAAFLTAKMRNLIPTTNRVSEHIIKYFFVSNCFFIATDPEYGLLKIISFLIIFPFFYFLTQIKFRFIKNKLNYREI